MPRSAIDRFDFEITGAEFVDEGENTFLVLGVTRSDDKQNQRIRIVVCSPNHNWRNEGRKSISELNFAIGLLASPEDEKDLIGGKATCLMYRSGKIVFIPVQLLEAA